MKQTRILLAVAACTLAIGGCLSEALGPGSGGVLSVVSGNGQTGPVNNTLLAPLVVLARDAGGTPLPGAEIAWNVIAASGPGASLSSSTSGTDASGEASVTVTLGSTAGSYTIQATTDGGFAEFIVNASEVNAGISVASGGGQVGTTGSVLPQPLVAQVLDASGSPLPEVEVVFAVVEGAGASASPLSAVTDSMGLASTTLTLGDSNGQVRVSATDGTNVTVFENWVCGGDAAAGSLSLAVGQDTTISGADIGCIQFGSQAAGAAYEVAVTATNTNLTFNSLEVFLAGAPAAAPPVVGPRFQASRLESRLAHRLRLQGDWDRHLRGIERPLLPAIRARAGSGAALAAPVPAVGDTLEFAFSCVSQSSFPGTPSSITGVVTEVSDRAVVVEDTVGSGAFTLAEYQTIAANFDDVIFATDTAYFGSPADIDSNGDRVVLLFSAGVNVMSDSSPNGYDDGIIAGFFCPTDLGGGGNNAEMFYLVMPDSTGEYTTAADEGLTKTEVLNFANGTVAHEFQHLINAQRGMGGASDAWLNEGLSHLAEEVVGHAATGLAPGSDLTLSDYDLVPNGVDIFNSYHIGNWFNLSQYLIQPSDTAGLVMASDPFGPATFRMRGTSWSFVRYLLDRFETAPTETTRTRALVQDGSADARDAVAAAFGVAFDSLVSDWSMMLAVDNQPGLMPRTELQLPSYRLRDMYAELADRSSAFPPGDFLLAQTMLDLAISGSREVDLFSYASDYLRLEAPAGSAAVGLRVGVPGTAGDLPTSVGGRVSIVRTN